MFPFLARASVACALVISGGWAHAQPDEELTLARAIDAALHGNPELAASAYELSAGEARIVQADLQPNPELRVELENFAGSGAARGFDALETTLSLSQIVDLGGKRAARRNAAEADFDLAGIEQRARELDVLSEVTTRFIDVVASQERVSFAGEAARLAQVTLDEIGKRVDAGRSPEAERSRARIALTRARIDQRQAASELRAARHALAATWGSSEPAFHSAKAELFNLAPVETYQALVERLDQSPDFTRFASETRLRQAELRLARVQARPSLAFNLGVRRFEEGGDLALVAGVSMPLVIRDRNQGAIRESEARLRQTDASLAAARTRARATLLGLYQQMSADRERVEILHNEALPQAELALAQTRDGYDRGRFSFLELVTAQEELLALRAATIDAAADYHRLLAEIERLTSAALTRPLPIP